MSLPAPYSEVYLAGDGVSTVFAFGDNFDPISDTLVECKIYFPGGYETVPTFTVDMATRSITISALTQPDGTILTAPPVGSVVRIYRDEPEAQNITASQLQSFTAKQLESALDAIVAMIQEVSYTVDHKTVRLTEPQRDIALQELSQLVDQHLIYWDFDSRKLVVTNFPQQDVVRCVNGLFFRLQTDPDTQEPYLQWSTDNSDWHGINVDAVNALAQSAYDLADDAYDLASTTRGELNAHKANHNNPHETTLANLVDTDLSGLTAGQFIMYDGLHWTNVNSSATISWGTILGNIDDQTDLKNALDAKVNLDGSSIMTAPLKFVAGSMRGAVGPYLNGVGLWKLDSQANLTLIATISDSQFIPNTTNAINFGSSTKKWKDLYLAGKAFVATINNGGDLAVPAVSGTLATKADVDLAANSGRMITDQGVWYAKMYTATVAPAAEDGTNYADFSQVDGQGNPIIVTYNRVNGAWVQDQTITPPAEYDGYVPITSKIWDIAEQTGQQGGRILWNHQSKEFTPYPQIISFEDIEVTGESTVIMPQDPSANQIVNKDYVDNHIPTGNFYHPDLFDWKWADHICNDVQWLRADTWSWQSGSVYEEAYQHIYDDYDDIPSSLRPMGTVSGVNYFRDPARDVYGATHEYAFSCFEESTVTTVYANTDLPEGGTDHFYSGSGNSATDLGVLEGNAQISTSVKSTIAYEKIGNTTVVYFTATDGHKIVLADQESNVAAIYAATGVAWYYILDTVNEQFKLPRTKFGVTGLRDAVGNYVEPSAPEISGSFQFIGPNPNSHAGDITGAFSKDGYAQGISNGLNTGGSWTGGWGTRTTGFKASRSSDIYKDGATIQQPATEQYLYFYVGEFTQTALENTAGLNAELFNDKVDVGHEVIAFQAPTADNNYTWYRKYADGWLEQGGQITTPTATGSASGNTTITFPQAFANTGYYFNMSGSISNSSEVVRILHFGTTTKAAGYVQGNAVYASSGGESYRANLAVWRAEGMAA